MAGSSPDPSGIAHPGRIRAARDLRALTQRQVVGQMKPSVTTAALSQIEAGKVRPTTPTLEALARALDVPIEFFFSQHVDGSSGDVLSRVPYFRDLAATPARERRRAGALALILGDLVAAIERRIRLPKLEVPDFAASVNATREEIDEIANAVRGEWDMGTVPIPHMVRMLERQGIPIGRLTMGTNSVDAFSVRFTNRPLIVLTDNKSNYVRSRFDAAHELGHLVMHRGSDPLDRRIEQQAHNFASSLLLPKQVAVEVLPSTLNNSGWSKLAATKREWGISMSALLFRSRDLGILTPDRYTNAMKYMSARGWRATEPGDLQMGLPESPSLFEKALQTITTQFEISTEDFVQQANLPLHDTIRLIRDASDRRPDLYL